MNEATASRIDASNSDLHRSGFIGGFYIPDMSLQSNMLLDI